MVGRVPPFSHKCGVMSTVAGCCQSTISGAWFIGLPAVFPAFAGAPDLFKSRWQEVREDSVCARCVRFFFFWSVAAVSELDFFRASPVCGLPGFLLLFRLVCHISPLFPFGFTFVCIYIVLYILYWLKNKSMFFHPLLGLSLLVRLFHLDHNATLHQCVNDC